MQPLYYIAPNGLVLTQLQDELMAAIPALAPVGGRASFYLTGNEATREVWLRVPDAVDPAAVQAVVNAHTPKTATPPPDSTRPPIPQVLLLKVKNNTILTGQEQANYNLWVLAMLRYLDLKATGSAG